MPSEVVLLFAGQGSRTTFSLQSSKKLLDKVSNHHAASLILRHCHEAFTQDAVSLTFDEKEILTEEDIKALKTPEDLAKPSAALAENPVVQAATLYLHQILDFVLYATTAEGKELPSILAETTGFCSGILAALVVATGAAIESPEFLRYAVGAFRLACRIAIRSALFSKAVAGTNWRGLPWSLVVMGYSREQLETFLKASRSQYSYQVGISALLDDDIFSLSGTGADLDVLRGLLPVTATCRPAFIHTLYHGGDSMEKTLQSILQDVQTLQIPFPDWDSLKCPVRSTIGGGLLAPGNADSESLVGAALRCMLIQPVDWNVTVQNILGSASQRLELNRDLRSRILALGPNASSLFSTAKSASLHPRLEIEHTSSKTPITTDEWRQNDIAIVGMSVDIPGSDNIHDFWNMLQNSTNFATEIPPSRFDLLDYYDDNIAASKPKPRRMAAKHGNFLKDPFHFDNTFFSISPREAKSMDPQQRLILQSALRALDDAGYAPNTTTSFQPDKMGVFIGAATGDYVENTRDDIDVYYSPGTLRAFLSGRISYAFGFKGPSVVIDTACSSSLVAIHQACVALERGDVVSALAGGVNVITSPDMYLGLARAHFLSPTGQCKPFDAAADGYCRAEGSAVFVLKRMEDALAHGDHIHAVIRGSMVNQSGTSKSITHPDADTQALLMKGLLERSKTSAQSISVVEAHGTGTQAGDLCEVTSIQSVLGQVSGRQHPLYLSSIKGNIGHSEAASGGVGLAKLVLMMQRKQIPPQASFQHLNPRLSSIADHNIVVPTRLLDWKSPNDLPRRALLNNFGAAGSNAALIVQEYSPTARVVATPSRSSHILNVSARTLEALEVLRAQYLELIIKNNHTPSFSVADLCYSANARRQQHREFRISVTGSSIQDLAEQLRKANPTKQLTRRAQPVTVFLFSGQANLYRGMGAELQATAPVFREAVRQCNAILRRHGFEEVTRFITNDDSVQGTDNEVVSQCACFVVQYALAALWQAWGIEPQYVIGHSVGEYAAFVVAGALGLESALLLVARRAQLMVSHCIPAKSGMVACKLSTEAAQSELAQLFGNTERLVVACQNSPEDCVVAGDADDITTFLRHCKTVGIKAVQLQVPFGFHSPAMEPMTDAFRQLCSDLKVTPSRIPVISSHLGKIVQTESLTADYFANHTRHAVKFADAINDLAISTRGQTMRILEIGHTSGTAAMAQKTLKDIPTSYASSLRPVETPWTTILTALKGLFLEGATVKWSAVYAGSATTYLDTTPRYPLFPAEFVVPYQEPTPDQVQKNASPDPKSVPRHFFELDKKSSQGLSNATFEARLSLMSSFIKAHVVGGTPLCPASIYIELALEAIDQQQPASKKETYVLRDITFESPLVYSENQGNNDSISLTVNQEDSMKGGPRYSFRAQGSDSSYCTGTSSVQAVTHVRQLLLRKSAFIKKQVEGLLGMGDAAGDIFSTRMIYNVVFPRVVSYSDPFLTLKRLRISPSGLEGYGDFRLPIDPSTARFICHPALIDTLLHTAGFVANNWIARDQACICVKLEKITLLPENITSSSGSDLKIYCNMVDCVDGFVIGDAYATDESGNIIAMAEGMHFKKTGLDAFRSYLARLAQGGKRHAGVVSSRDRASPTIPPARPTNDNIVRTVPTPDIAVMLQQQIQQLCGMSSDVNVDADLAQFGIDSLLFIELTQAIRGGLPNIDTSSLDLSRCSTLREMEAVLLQMAGSTASSDVEVHRNDAVAVHEDRPQISTPTFTEPKIMPFSESPLTVVMNMVQDICGCRIFDLDKDVSLESLGVDSLLSMELEQGLRRTAGITMDGDHGIISELTVGQLERLILDQLSQSVSLITPESSPSPVTIDPVTQLQNAKTKTNRLYLFHDGSGLSHQYAKLAPLGCEVFGVSSLDFAGVDPSVQSLEDFASRYISALKLAESHEDGIILGGWSFGGVLAFEIARQLHGLGSPAKGLILLDSPCPIDHEPLPGKVVEHIAATAFGTNPSIRPCIEAQFKRNAGFLKKYKPALDQISIPSVMLLSRETCDASILCGLRYPWLDHEPYRKKSTQEWRRVVGENFQTLEVEGNHFNMFASKHLESLSQKMVLAYQALA